MQNQHAKQVETLTLEIIKGRIHDRKRNTIFNGLPGNANEPPRITREKVLDLSVRVYNVTNPIIQACHRLNRSANAAVIVAFCDQYDHDIWIEEAKKLGQYNKQYNITISVQQDLPVALRCCKNEQLKLRKELPLEDKKGSFIKCLPRWPYVQLNRKSKPAIHHPFTKSDIVEKYIKC